MINVNLFAMNKLHFVLFCAFFVLACGKKSDAGNQQSSQEASATTTEKTATAVTENKPKGSIFRCDGFYPGIASEYLQVDFNAEKKKIEAIWYWNTQDEKKISLKIFSQKYTEGEISGFDGELQFPDNDDKVAWGCVEDRFNLTHKGDRFQEFELEQ